MLAPEAVAKAPPTVRLLLFTSGAVIYSPR